MTGPRSCSRAATAGEMVRLVGRGEVYPALAAWSRPIWSGSPRSTERFNAIVETRGEAALAEAAAVGRPISSGRTLGRDTSPGPRAGRPRLRRRTQARRRHAAPPSSPMSSKRDHRRLPPQAGAVRDDFGPTAPMALPKLARTACHLRGYDRILGAPDIGELRHDLLAQHPTESRQPCQSSIWSTVLTSKQPQPPVTSTMSAIFCSTVLGLPTNMQRSMM